MTRLDDIERAIDSDLLSARLMRVETVPVADALRAGLLAGSKPAPRGRRRRRLATGLGGGAAAIAILAMTPAGPALARSVLPEGILQKLNLFEGTPPQLIAPGGAPVTSLHPVQRLTPPHGSPIPCSQVPAKPPYPQVPQAVDCYPDLSLVAAQQQVDFAIPTPHALPDGVTYDGAVVGIAMDAPHSSVLLSYLDSVGTRSIGLEVVRGTPHSGSGVPSGSAERVQVDGGPAYYVHGSYGSSGPGATARWNPDADDEELTWQRDGMTFDLTAAGLHYSSIDLVRIAESVR
jgi:hypothetical protein